jgi:hypothetical protein
MAKLDQGTCVIGADFVFLFMAHTPRTTLRD